MASKALFLKMAQAKKRLPGAVKSTGLVVVGTIAGAIVTQKIKSFAAGKTSLANYSKFSGPLMMAGGAALKTFAGNEMVNDFASGFIGGATTHAVLDLMGEATVKIDPATGQPMKGIEGFSGLGFNLAEMMGIQSLKGIEEIAVDYDQIQREVDAENAANERTTTENESVTGTEDESEDYTDPY